MPKLDPENPAFDPEKMAALMDKMLTELADSLSPMVDGKKHSPFIGCNGEMMPPTLQMLEVAGHLAGHLMGLAYMFAKGEGLDELALALEEGEFQAVFVKGLLAISQEDIERITAMHQNVRIEERVKTLQKAAEECEAWDQAELEARLEKGELTSDQFLEMIRPSGNA
jgi:hypothetical protein|tara:strand:- start:13 stop:516 length:504 start_codon:yes stop_codon:yes gene_type:complete